MRSGNFNMDRVPDGYYWAVRTNGRGPDEPVMVDSAGVWFFADDTAYTFADVKDFGFTLYPLAARIQEQ